MAKLFKIKFTKEYADKKIGDIANCSKKSAESYVKNGYAEYIEELGKVRKVKGQKKKPVPEGVGIIEVKFDTLPVKQLEEEIRKLISMNPLEVDEGIDELVKRSGKKKSRIKEQLKIFKKRLDTTNSEKLLEKDFDGFYNHIINFMHLEEHLLLQEMEKSYEKYNLAKGDAAKIINAEKKKAKEKEREERQVESKSKMILKEALIETIDETWETCDDELFIKISEDDWRKAKYYFVLRLLKEHTYKVDEEDICGIRTFEDNKEIIIYNPKTGIYAQDGDLYLAHLIESRLKEKAENKQVSEIIESIKRKTYYSRENLNEQPKNIKPVGNGLLKLKEQELLAFTPKYIFLNKINIDYNKNATCEKFKVFLSQVLQTDKDSDIVQEWCGYCLLNDTNYSKALLLFGDGENGKSVLLNVIKRFLGNENVTSISLQYLESSPFAPARLFGKTANIFADLPKKALSQTSVFKMTVAGDDISGEKKGKDSFEFKPTAKMMFSCNEIPRTPDRTRGFFRRWIILKFLEHFPEGDPNRDEHLFEKLVGKEELEGVLNFAVQGLRKLGVQKGFTQNMKMHEIQEFWTRSSDSIATFAADNLIQCVGETEKKIDVYSKYEEYCNKNQYLIEEINNFWKRLRDVISFSEHQITDGNFRIRVVKGVQIKK